MVGGLALQPSVTTLRMFAQTSVSNTGNLVTDFGGMDIRGPSGVTLGTLDATGAVSVTASGGAIALTAPLNAASLSLSSGGDITQPGAGAGISVGMLHASAGGNVALAGAGNQVGTLGTSSAGGNFALVDATSLTTTGKLTAGGTVSLNSGGTLSLQGAVDPTTVTLYALGDIIQAGSGAGISATTLLLTAGGNASLGGAGNQILALGAGSAGGNFTLVNLGNLSATAGFSAGGTLQLSTTGALLLGGALRAETLTALGAGLTLDGAQLTLGRGGLLGAPGGIAALAPSTLAALDPLRLPVLVLDGRGLGALTSLPGFAQPDQPGLAATAQFTQLGAFGVPRAAAALPVSLNLSAGDSPVFLLVDSASVAGHLSAGRLGLFGLGGSANLEGVLAGASGGAAASQAFIVLAFGNGGLANYVFNGSQFTPIASAADSLVTFPTNVLINFSDAGSAGGGPVTGSGGAGSTTSSGAGAGGPTMTERTETTEAVVAEAAPAVAPRATFVRRFLPPSSAFRTRPLQGRMSGGEVELPNAGGRDF
jgi:filamentous hemagglutinin